MDAVVVAIGERSHAATLTPSTLLIFGLTADINHMSESR